MEARLGTELFVSGVISSVFAYYSGPMLSGSGVDKSRYGGSRSQKLLTMRFFLRLLPSAIVFSCQTQPIGVSLWIVWGVGTDAQTSGLLDR